ncbi:OmpA family protein [Sessilibacter corallicola]|uniref:OmpA family protein n=1 Tax=Sessilibacter corallicola TaxID=2904075 RepID=A0ABQ0A410_9GAMM
MKNIVKNIMTATLASTMSAAAVTAFADDYEPGFTVTPGVGYYFFDSDSNIDDDTLFSLALGYQFDNPWAVELVYLNADSESDNSLIGDIDVEQYRLDGLYHFSRSGKWQPYLAGGIGDIDYEATRFSVDDNDTIFNFGGGAKYQLSKVASLRPDLRLIHGIEESTFDVAFTLGLSFLLGATESSAPVKKSKPVEPAVVAGPADADNDGVIDSRDQCPNTPNGVRVDSNGCPLDSDKDGVADYKDSCPDSALNAKVDSRGCYIELTEDKEVQLNVRFANNSAEVPQSAYPEIESVAKFMREYAGTSVVIEGHTDDRGAAAYNQQLSERRAKAVADVLIQEFRVSGNSVSSVGYGEEKPVVSNDTAENRATNRRVVAVVKATVKTRAEK